MVENKQHKCAVKVPTDTEVYKLKGTWASTSWGQSNCNDMHT